MKEPVKIYLATYNLLAFIMWTVFLFGYITSGLAMNSLNLVFLDIAQGLAVLEILHAVLKWVKSPVASTAAQVSSRILVLVLLNVFVGQYATVPVFKYGAIIVSFAWAITELVRYSLYFLGLFDKQPAALLWARYSFFILLYPLGVTGEWLIMATPIAANGITFSLYNCALVFLLVAYLYYFPVLYKYMWKQRKAKLA